MEPNKLIKAVLFDFDGTLTQPGAIDFHKIKEIIRCPDEIPILEFIETLNPEDAAAADVVLERFEQEAAPLSMPNTGAEDIIRFLRSKNMGVGLITRNRHEHVIRSLENFSGIGPDAFDVIISRDTPVAPKPSPEGVLLAAEKLGICPEEILVAGDYIFDIYAGNRAGAVTAFLSNGKAAPADAEKESDYVVESLAELRKVIRLYLPLPAGKFPNDLLKKFLDHVPGEDPSVIIRPGIGEDTAAVSVEGEDTLILKSDPITFATDAIGHYAVLINANDIATSGAIPRWLLTTLLFPCGITPVEIFQVLNDLESVCRKWNITLCGGHTEITDAVNRPVIAGTLAGTVARSGLIDKKAVRSGDCVLLTKGLAVEGTTIIAREFGDRLLELGMSETAIRTCRDFLGQLSILDEARIAAACPGTTALHDVTEGGLSSALEELSVAGGHKIRVHMENIPVLPQTEAVCRLMNIHPLGLIGSGSLLICCRESHVKQLIAGIATAGIQVTYIGEVMEPGEGVEALWEGKSVEWPRFEVDEIARLFE